MFCCALPLSLSLHLRYTAFSMLSHVLRSLSLPLSLSRARSLRCVIALAFTTIPSSLGKLGSTSPHPTPPQLSSLSSPQPTTLQFTSLLAVRALAASLLSAASFHPKLGQPLNPLSRRRVDVNVDVAVAAAAGVAASAACAVVLLLLLFGRTQHVFFGSEDACRPTVTCCDVD